MLQELADKDPDFTATLELNKDLSAAEKKQIMNQIEDERDKAKAAKEKKQHYVTFTVGKGKQKQQKKKFGKHK